MNWKMNWEGSNLPTNKDYTLSNWISEKGPNQDIVLSSRMRLARNLEKITYPNRAGKDELNKVIESVKETASNQDDFDLYFINIQDLPEVERQLLVEKNLTSPAHIEKKSANSLLLNNEENISIMINEEDHLRVQILLPGFQLDQCWEKADKIDDIFEKKLDFAFSEKYGYLSTCPTNLGTGLRASVMVHLPALNLTNNINKMLEAISQLGLVVRGIYGEGSESAGNIYQISNQITLGNSEGEIVDNLKSVTTQIIEQERNARQRLLKEQEVNVRDEIMRAYGILKYAYKISSEEALKLLSYVSLGIDMEIIDDVDSGMLNELMILIRPAHLQKNEGKALGTQKRDLKRAELIKERFK